MSSSLVRKQADLKRYQMSLEPLLVDHGREQAETIMRGAIDLVSSSSGSGSAGVVLSLGPYGATLSPSQEYGGIYPSPYGPNVSPSSSSSARTNAFPSTANGHAEELEAEDALAEWHLSRLRIYAAEEGTWRKVEWLGFETIPLLREIRAIRRAMEELHKELEARWGGGKESDAGEGEWWRQKFWITSAFPDGQHPQHLPSSADQHVSVDDVLDSLVSSSPDSAKPLPRPNGIGINCTHPSHISNLAEAFTTSMRKLAKSGGEAGPVFVLYPDGGAVYDTTSRTWTERTTRPDEWAVGVAGIARRLEDARLDAEGEEQGGKLWAGVIVGGCCKAGFDEIRYLRKELDRLDA
jgi:homocysteine S-methyltransferase